MKMLRIATVEDDTHDLEALRTHLKRYEKENGLKFLITEFRDGEDIVTDYSADYDLILMDIEMAFLNGMKAAEKIRELDKDVVIIFITNMPQYAIQGYKVNALDYMLNLEYVDNYMGSDVSVNGDIIQVSRSRRKPFLDALNEYLNEVGK